MKKCLLILALFIFTGFSVFAQGDDNDDRGGKLQQRMQEYIQKRLSLSRSEAEKFSPVFIRYIVELRKTHRENNTDKPMLQLKVAELRIRYRSEFRQILDEQKANRIFECQREFEEKIKQELINRRLDNRPNRHIKTMLY